MILQFNNPTTLARGKGEVYFIVRLSHYHVHVAIYAAKRGQQLNIWSGLGL